MSARFEKFIERMPFSGCWLWIGTMTEGGYGIFYLSKTDPVLAHRHSYQQHVGSIPQGLELDHLCRVKSCVNPAHLEAVTHRENVLRGQGVAALHAAKTHCVRGHPLEPMPNANRRFCRVCSRAANRRSYAKRRPK